MIVFLSPFFFVFLYVKHTSANEDASGEYARTKLRQIVGRMLFLILLMTYCI